MAPSSSRSVKIMRMKHPIAVIPDCPWCHVGHLILFSQKIFCHPKDLAIYAPLPHLDSQSIHWPWMGSHKMIYVGPGRDVRILMVLFSWQLDCQKAANDFRQLMYISCSLVDHSYRSPVLNSWPFSVTPQPRWETSDSIAITMSPWIMVHTVFLDFLYPPHQLLSGFCWNHYGTIWW